MAEEVPKISKKEANKAAKKEKAKAGPLFDDSTVPAVYAVQFCRDNSANPDLTRLLESLGSVPKVRYTHHPEAKKSLPVLTKVGEEAKGTIAGDVNMARFLAKTHAPALYGEGDAWLQGQADQWLEVYQYAVSIPSYSTSTLPALLESVLTHKTFLVGEALSLADLAIFLLLKKQNVALGESAALIRWTALVASFLPAEASLPLPIPLTFVAAPKKEKEDKKGAAPAAAGNAGEKKKAEKKGAEKKEEEEEGGSCPALVDAVEGEVCTRFPPEPSGYLHIGHAKAVLLNQYYAQRYKGKMLVRFDDTNPSKEKEEFEENILHDLKTLGINPDRVSHSSDYFSQCEEVARKMLLSGKAYMDDTDQETMQKERLERKESKNRNTAPEENVKIFEKLLRGEPDTQKYCMRAKIDMQSVNGTMRDPVLYRFNDTPHHRTGTKYKAYPTYDFVCPILDAIEGVTHALRTTEYNDRDEQYHWIQKALDLRHVHIQTFGKMNFVHTVLSKRKLNWFVENGLVEGWFDPRFPTIQGCVRRGVNVEALKNFIISQGASRRVITMEWDKFWSENKKILEEKCARYMAVSVEDVVTMELLNVPAQITHHSVQVHPQKPEFGMRVMRRFNKIYIDQIDAVTYKVGEEVTLLRWGNMKIEEIVKDEATGKVLSIKATYNADATNFSKTKKATWLAAVPDVVPAKLVEFDHLISKAKIEEEEKFQDFINPVTRAESDALCDPLLRTLNAGEVIQIERKGFFRVDQPYGGEGKPAILFAIPDGKAKSLNAALKK